MLKDVNGEQKLIPTVKLTLTLDDGTTSSISPVVTSVGQIPSVVREKEPQP